MDLNKSWLECRLLIADLLDKLASTVEKIQQDKISELDRLVNIESKCKICDPAKLHLRLVMLETQCKECNNRRSFWHIGLKDLTIGVLVTIIGGMALWYFTRGGG